jgi:CRISPR-associated protein Csm5
MAAADSRPVDRSAFKIFLSRVASLDARQSGKPQLAWKVAGRGSVPAQRMMDSTPAFAEMAIPGTSFSGEWEERIFLENDELRRDLGWRSPVNVKSLVDAANEFASAQLDVHEKYAEVTGMGALGQTIQRLKGQLESARNSPLSCLLCVGWGGGFVSKAGFLDTEGAAYRKVLRTVPGIGRSIREGVPFPKTRRIIFAAGQPASIAGWLRFELGG